MSYFFNLFNKRSVTQKMMVANVFFGFILVGLLYLLLSAKSEPINFATAELKGNSYQKSLEPLLESLSNHRIYSQLYLLGDQSSQGMVSALDAKIESFISTLETTQGTYGVDLQFTDEGLKGRNRSHLTIANLKSEFQALKVGLSKMSVSDSNEKHAHLISDIRGMIAHAGDTSNLILDPDLDSYYLMDATLVALPQNQDRIQNIINTVEPWLQKRSDLTTAERTSLSVFAAMLKEADSDRIGGDFQTALNEDKNFYGVLESFQKNVPESHQAYLKMHDQFINLLNDLAASGKTIDPHKFRQAGVTALEKSFQLWHTSVTELDKLLEARVDYHTKAKTMAMIISISGLAAFFIFSWFFSKSLGKSLADLATKIGVDSRNVFEVADKMNEVSQSLAQSTTEQSTALQQTASAIEEMKSMVQRIAESASESRVLANKSHEVATQGKQSVDRMGGAILDISKSNDRVIGEVEENNRKIKEIVDIINVIGNKTKVINDIVFQTKLLSFNASVEAARAGEHGKGFAVVAEEVGNLAQMSGQASKEIENMLNTSITKVENIIRETQTKIERIITEGKEHISTGNMVAKECGEVLEAIVQNVSKVNTLIGDISTAMNDQSTGISEITTGVNQLDESMHQNATSSQQVAGSSESLRTQSDSLNLMVNRLNEFVRGEGNSVETGEYHHEYHVDSKPMQHHSTQPVEDKKTSKKTYAFKKKSSDSPDSFKNAVGS